MAARSARAPRQATQAAPSQDKASLAKLLSHSTRVQILAAAHRQAISPSEFAREHGLTTSSVAQHFRKLADYGAIKLVRKEPVRGSVKHMYVGTKRGILTEADWQTLPESVQSDLATAGLQDFIGVTVHAIEAGSFTERDDFVFTWDEVELDELAWKTLTQMLTLLWKKTTSLEEESAVRRAQSGEKGFKAVVGLAAYGAPRPAESNGGKPGRQAK
jgi:DNA-binding transcriptional ArsR family regulator